MKKLYFLVPLAVILLLLAACASNDGTQNTKLVTKYDISLVKVVKTEDPAARYKAPVADTTLVNKLRFRWEDETLRTIWSASENGFELTLYNASGKPISLNWDKALYLDYDNIGHRIVLGSGKDSEKDKPLGSSTVVPQGNLVETIFSADNISLSSLLGVYVRTPMLPTDFASATRYVGKELKLILPFTIDGKPFTYEQTFKVTKVRQVQQKSSSLFGL